VLHWEVEHCIGRVEHWEGGSIGGGRIGRVEYEGGGIGRVEHWEGSIGRVGALWVVALGGWSIGRVGALGW